MTFLLALALQQAVGPGEPLRAEVRLPELGVASVEAVRRGRVAVVEGEGGPRLVVQLLTARLRPQSSLADSLSPFRPWTDPPPAAELDSAPGEAPGEGDERALWVWNTRTLLDDDHARAEFLSFVVEGGFTRVFLHLARPEGVPAEAGFVPFDGRELGPLLAALHARGLEVDALDGDPRYALPDARAGVLRTVARIREHNASAPSAERFDGVHYDIEPYLVPGFAGWRRQEILDGWASVARAVAREARAGGLRVGFDIPFWLDGADAETGAFLTARAGGEELPLLVHLLRAADEVVVMGYRTQVDGPNGSAALVAREVEVAGRLGARVLVGLESEPLADEALRTFRGEPVVGLPPMGRGGAWVTLVPLGEDRAAVWLLEGPAARASLRRALATAGVEEGAVRSWWAELPRPVPGSRLSFHGLGRDAMEGAAAALEARFRDRPAFAGTAFHHYGSLRELEGGLEGG